MYFGNIKNKKRCPIFFILILQMSRSIIPFHISESLLASIDGKLCQLLKEIQPKTTKQKKFDEIWITHLDTLVELVKMHVDIMQQCSEYLINMNQFDKMCKTIDSMVSGFGIPELKPFSDRKGLSLSATNSSKLLADYFAKALRVWKNTASLDITPYNETDKMFMFKFSLTNIVTQRIQVCDLMIGLIKWYIETLKILSRNFESLNQTHIVENILKPGCRIFRIPETSTLDQLIERATELLRIKEHPEPFSPVIAIAVTKMMRKVEKAKRRTEVHEMMQRMYSSKTRDPMMAETDSLIKPHNFQTRFELPSPISHILYTPRKSFGEAMNFAEQTAATKIQRMYRKKSNKRSVGYEGKKSKTKKL